MTFKNILGLKLKFYIWFLTPYKKENGINWNHDIWLSQQRTNKIGYALCCWWTNQELKQKTVKVQILRLTTTKKVFVMPFGDTNTHLMTEQYNFYIKCNGNSESYDQHGTLEPNLGGVRIVIDHESFFLSTREKTLWLNGWTLSYGTLSWAIFLKSVRARGGVWREVFVLDLWLLPLLQTILSFCCMEV